MKFYIYSIVILISVFSFKNIHSQNLENGSSKYANTIRIYVNDPTSDQAIERFVDYINQTGFQVNYVKTQKVFSDTSNQNCNPFQLNRLNNEPRLILYNNNSGDTITTALASLYNVMMGQYSARLKFYLSKDNDKLYIVITGYVSSNAFGNEFYDLKMQKGGKGSNWAQRDLFANLNNCLLNYSDVENIVYLKE